ncbi:hypothetical protein F383_21497 [Gossypium arboreum]|uniref:Uncharacterized protein n=1 Tax=Gossypium arboreum TaxID=29729 RepID=A0A0B0NWN8_GOSAR|nr:hypothetical protein F383_21497 [Gossypium arboreum]
MGWDTGMCLSRVRHTAMLHGRVSPRVPYNSQVSLNHGQGARACLVAV